MKLTVHSIRRGFTLVELTVAIMLGMMTGSMVLAMFNQQIAFLSIYKQQNFLAEEAPVISMYVGSLVGKADRFRLHDSLQDALANKNPRGAPTDPPSPVLVLNYQQPDGTAGGTTMRAAILAFHDIGSGPALYYYVVPVSGVLGAPQWKISSKPSKVDFQMENGVLRMALEGPLDPKISGYIPERITYSGAMQQ